MLNLIKTLFSDMSDTPDAPAKVDDGRLALAALLVAAARQDDDYRDGEKKAIERILAIEHGLATEDAVALREKAEAEEEGAMGLFRFTHRLKETTPFEDRVQIVEHLWEVALADGDRDAEEDNLIRRVCGLLGVADRDSGLARQRVEARES